MQRQDGPVATLRATLRAARLALAAVGALAALAAVPAAAQSGRPLRLVAFGDSLMAGYGLPAAAAYPQTLERALREKGHKVEIVNAGVSGDTASAGLERLDWSVPDGTDGVILELGANDMLRGIDPAVPRRAIGEIVARLKARNIPVLLAGMTAAPNLGPDYGRRFDGLYRDIANANGLVFYPFFLDGVAGDRSLNLADGMHPTAKGVETIVARMLPTVETFLKRLTAT